MVHCSLLDGLCPTHPHFASGLTQGRGEAAHGQRQRVELATVEVGHGSVPLPRPQRHAGIQTVLETVTGRAGRCAKDKCALCQCPESVGVWHFFKYQTKIQLFFERHALYPVETISSEDFISKENF